MLGLSFSPRISVPLTASNTGASREDTTRVPARPWIIARISCGAPMTPIAPSVFATKSATAATFGSMLPAPNSPASIYLSASSTVIVSSHCCSGVPKRIATLGTPVGMSSMSAPRSCAKKRRGDVLVDAPFDADEPAIRLYRHRNPRRLRPPPQRCRHHGARELSRSPEFLRGAARPRFDANRVRRPPRSTSQASSPSRELCLP